MKPAERFFRKYCLSMLGTIALFLLLNAVLLCSVLVWAWETSKTPGLSAEQVYDRIPADGAGSPAAAEGLAKLLEERHAWVMLLDNTGTVIFQERLPEELPRQYTLTDVAKFSRWYLSGYPVHVWEHPAGLLVIGYEKGSRVKYSFSLREGYVEKLFAGFAAAFLINILAVVLLLWKDIRHVEKAVAPILRGIETVSSGLPVSLPEKGELAEISRQLNKAGAVIVKKDSARAEWISGISHDIRTPLSVILGFAGQMEENGALPAAAREQAAYIRRQGEKLRSLVADLNLASKLEYAMQPLRMEKVFAVEMARQAVCEFLDGGMESRYEISFASDPQSERASMWGDSALLKRALYNLIQNSVTHNPGGCDISVVVLCDENRTAITVSDNGVGVSTEKLQELRRKTRRMDNTDENLNLRHGLGVRLVWQIVEAHHGRMEIDSTPQNGYQTRLIFPNRQIA